MVAMVSTYAERPLAEVPPLQQGDNLSRDEFERLWDLHPEIKHAELINGIVYLELSVSPDHAMRHSAVIGWLVLFSASAAGTEVGDNATVSFADGSELQPDALLRRTGRAGRSGRSRIAIEGPPEFVFEVSASSAAYDMHQKFDAYERNGVLEYVVWQLYEDRIDWFVLRDGRYERHTPGPGGIIESTQFPGLRLDVPKMLAGDLPGVLAALSA